LYCYIVQNMNDSFDETTYRRLLADIAPRKIESEAEYDRLLAITEKLHFTKTLQTSDEQRESALVLTMTSEQRAIYKLLVILIEAYESEKWKMDEAKPHEILQHIMESSGIRQKDLVAINVGSSGVVSEIINGKRAISKAQAKILGHYFKVSSDLFV
jgi:HTH-type transcriptional regulator / antitoxin HigA